jgi:hypothetical protein
MPDPRRKGLRYRPSAVNDEGAGGGGCCSGDCSGDKKKKAKKPKPISCDFIDGVNPDLLPSLSERVIMSGENGYGVVDLDEIIQSASSRAGITLGRM